MNHPPSTPRQWISYSVSMSVVFTLLVMCQKSYEVDARQCRSEYSIRNMMLKGHVFSAKKTVTWLKCEDKCSHDVRCQSFNYVISQRICELNNRTKEAKPEEFVPDSDRFYIKRLDGRVPVGSVPELPAESCAEIWASEGEDAVSGNYWFNSIKPGEVVLARCNMFTQDIDDCASHPCKNNGTCIDQVNGFNCSCSSGFNGTQCETDIDDCTSHPCKNNGTCTDRVNGFNCSCAPGFNGVQCETADICNSYKTLTDAERRYDHVTVNFKCDRTLNGWYRFQGAAGTKMLATCPPLRRCGAEFPAWLREDHPTVAEGTVTRIVCIHRFRDCCNKLVLIQVKNCGSYYIYKLNPPVKCHVRYCSAD